MRICHNRIHSFAAGFPTQTFGQLVDDTIHAAYGRYNPHLVANSHFAIFTAITFECQVFVWNIQRNACRIVCIIQQSSQICLDIILIHPIPLFLSRACMTDRVPIFNDVFAFCKVFQCKFMSGGHFLTQSDFRPVHRELFSCRQCHDSDSYIICRVDFKVLSFHNYFIIYLNKIQYSPS